MPFFRKLGVFMQLFKNEKLHITIKILCMLCIIAMMSISFLVYHASPPKFALFFSFIIFFVQLPGNAIIYFSKINTKHLSEKILLGLFTGWSLIVLEYFICDLIQLNLIYYVNIILDIFFLYTKFKEKPNKHHFIHGIPTTFFIAVVITLFYTMLLTQYRYLAPGTGTAIFSTSDKAFQMGIVNSLVKGFPATNPWVDGATIHYHIFSQILYAAAIGVFPSLTSDFIIMSCGPYLLTFSLCTAFYALFKRFCKKSDRAELYTLLIILSHPFAARSPIKSYIFQIMLINDNFGGYGVAATISWIVLLDIYFNDSEGRTLPVSILTVANFMLITGIKAPIGLVMLGALVGALILAAIMKELKLTDVFLAVVSGISFSLIYKVLLVSNSSGSGSSSSIFAFAKINNMCFWKDSLIDFLAQYNITGFGKLFIIMLLFFISFFSIFFFPMCVGYIREFVLVISRKKPFNIPQIVIYAATLVGTVLMLTTNYAGHSQIYFGIVAFSFSSLITFWFFEDVSLNSAKWMQRLRKVCIYLFSLILITSTISLGLRLNDNFSLATMDSDPNHAFEPYRSLSLDELEAMNWIKENTPEDALLATQMYSSVPHDQYSIKNRYHNCHFLYAVFSCRNYYLEGSGFSINSDNISLRKRMLAINKVLFDVSSNDRGELANNLGIDYVVVTKFVDGSLKLDNKNYVKCFSNDSIDIFEIK